MDEYESRQERTLPHAPRTESYERHSRIKYGAPHLMRWTERLRRVRGGEVGVMAEGVYFVDAVGREIVRRRINERRPPCRHDVRG